MAIATRIDLDTFQEQGFLVVENVLEPERDLDPVVAEYAALLDDLTQGWHADGKLASTFGDLPFAQRFARVLNEAPRDLNVMATSTFHYRSKGSRSRRPSTSAHKRLACSQTRACWT